MILLEILEEVIEREIRPLLREHHGDIALRGLEGKDVRVALLGACRTCPAAQITIEQTIQRILTEQLGDQIGQVILVNETDPELLDFAKQLLNRKNKDTQMKEPEKMNWKDLYKQKLTTADKAIEAIHDNNRVIFAHAAGVPQEITRALVAHKENYHNVEIFHMLCLGDGAYTQPDMAPHFRHNTNFVGANTRQAIEEDRADFIPCFFYELPRLFRDGTLPVDVAVLQLSKPNEEGYCSYGVSCDYTKPAAEVARVVIAEINDQMPQIGGDNYIHVSKIDYIVETSNPLYEIPLPKIGEIEQAIGRNCAQLIEDGSTLQLGIGAIPDAVLQYLKEKKDLGIHTEMFSDGVVDLVELGVVNGKAKTLHPGKLVATFIMGTKRLYDFVNNNPNVELYSVDYVNDPYVIRQNDKMVSINSCIEVDLTGQVCSEMIGPRQFSGTGGQIDYVRGATLSKGGKSILAMPSTAAKGKVSRIVLNLAAGAAVTTPRDEVDYIVTEYGIAHLKGKTLRQRAESLIRIAHPDFRATLAEEFRRRFPLASINLD